MDASVQRAPAPFPFLRLPAELRNNIYKYAFESAVIEMKLHHPIDRSLLLTALEYRYRYRFKSSKRKLVRHISSLSLTRQVHQESKMYQDTCETLKIEGCSQWIDLLISLGGRSFDTVRTLVISGLYARHIKVYVFLGPEYQAELRRLAALSFPKVEAVVLDSANDSCEGTFRWVFNKPDLRVEGR